MKYNEVYGIVEIYNYAYIIYTLNASNNTYKRHNYDIS